MFVALSLPLCVIAIAALVATVMLSEMLSLNS